LLLAIADGYSCALFGKETMRPRSFCPRPVLTFVVAAIAAAALPLPAGAADAQNDNTLPPAYEEQILERAEILGSLHYLRELCQAGENGLWRTQMEGMLSAEQPSANRKAYLVARFNRGFRALREVYRACTPAAAEAANRYLRQGMRIAAEIPNRYGQ